MVKTMKPMMQKKGICSIKRDKLSLVTPSIVIARKPVSQNVEKKQRDLTKRTTTKETLPRSFPIGNNSITRSVQSTLLGNETPNSMMKNSLLRFYMHAILLCNRVIPIDYVFWQF